MNIYVFHGFLAFLCIMNQIFEEKHYFSVSCIVSYKLCEKCRLHKSLSVAVSDFYSIKIGGKVSGSTTLIKEIRKNLHRIKLSFCVKQVITFNQTTMLNTTEPDKLIYPKQPPYSSIRVSRLATVQDCRLSGVQKAMTLKLYIQAISK